MKKLLSFILCVTLLLGVFPFVLPVTAVETVDVRSTEFGNLYDNAVFVSNGGNDTTGKVNDKVNPFATINAAANALIAAHDGGYIVIMDAITCSVDVDYNDHNGVICITSVYDGVDYRNSGAMIVGGITGFGIMQSGPTIFEKISFKICAKGSAATTSIYITARHNPLQIGDDDLKVDDIAVYYADGTKVTKSNAGSSRFIVIGGYATGKTKKQITSGVADMGTETNVIIKAGVYDFIGAGNYSLSNASTSMAKHFFELHAGYVDELYGGNISGGVAGVTMLHLFGGEVNKCAPGGSASGSSPRGNTYTYLGNCKVNSIIGYFHQSTDTELYDVLVYDPSVYTSTSMLPSTTEFEHVIPALSQAGNTENTVYVKTGGVGNGATSATPCVDLTTAFMILGDKGGIISLCGDLGISSVSANQRFEINYLGVHYQGTRYFIEPYHTGKVTITSNGEYTLSTGGKLAYIMSGPTTFDNVTVSSTDSFYLVARFNDCEIKETATFDITNEFWFVCGEALQHTFNGKAAAHRNRGRFTTGDRSVNIKLSDVELDNLYGFTGAVPYGLYYTGNLDIELDDVSVSGSTVLGLRGSTNASGSSGSATMIMNGNTNIPKFWPASSFDNALMTKDVTVIVNGGTIESFGNGNFVVGTATLVDNTGNKAMCKRAALNGFDVVTGYKKVTLVNPNTVEASDVSALYLDGLSLAGNEGNLRILKSEGDKFTILVPEDTTASTIQMVTETDNYAYTVCPVHGVMTANRAEAFDNAFITDGFSIRSVPTADRLQGLRFKTQITNAAVAAACEFGTLVKKSAKTVGLVLPNVDASDAAKGDVAKSIAASENGTQYFVEVGNATVTYATAVAGIPVAKEAYETSFTFRAYVSAKIDGKTYTFYGEELANNIYAVAKLVTDDPLPEFVQSVITTVEAAQ